MRIPIIKNFAVSLAAKHLVRVLQIDILEVAKRSYIKGEQRLYEMIICAVKEERELINYKILSITRDLATNEYISVSEVEALEMRIDNESSVPTSQTEDYLISNSTTLLWDYDMVVTWARDKTLIGRAPKDIQRKIKTLESEIEIFKLRVRLFHL